MKISTRLLALCLLMMPLSKGVAQMGKVLVEEHFDENDRGWSLGSDNDVVRKIEGGKFILECKKYLTNKGGFWIKVPDLKLPANNFSISVTTHWIKNMKTDDSYSSYGILVGDYYFLIYGDGNRRLLKYNSIDKKYETIVDWGENSALNKKDNGDNKLEIQYKDGKGAFYANGQMLYKKDVTITEGTLVKLYIENSEVVSFDDLIVKVSEGKTTDAENSNEKLLHKILANKDDVDFEFSIAGIALSPFKYYMRNDSLWFRGTNLYATVIPVNAIDFERTIYYLESSLWETKAGDKCIEVPLYAIKGKLYAQEFDIAQFEKRFGGEKIDFVNLILPNKAFAEELIKYLKAQRP